jgi:hypothetical protein
MTNFTTGKLRDLLEWLCSDIKKRGLKLDYNGKKPGKVLFNRCTLIKNHFLYILSDYRWAGYRCNNLLCVQSS